MGIITPGAHRILDFLSVAMFAAGPTLFRMHGRSSMAAYGLAVLGLLLTLLTYFPGKAPRPIPYRVHGAIELVLGLLLVAIPLLRQWTGGARVMFLALGISTLIIWALTPFRDATAPAARPVA